MKITVKEQLKPVKQLTVADMKVGTVYQTSDLYGKPSGHVCLRLEGWVVVLDEFGHTDAVNFGTVWKINNDSSPCYIYSPRCPVHNVIGRVTELIVTPE